MTIGLARTRTTMCVFAVPAGRYASSAATASRFIAGIITVEVTAARWRPSLPNVVKISGSVK